MNHKERVIRTIKGQETDRIPFDMSGREDDLIQHLQLENREALYEHLGIDFWHLSMNSYFRYTGEKKYRMGYEADFWQVPKICKEGDNNELCPLFQVTTLEALESYQFPSVKDFDFSHVYEEVDAHRNFYVIGGIWAPIFHNYVRICGYENGLVQMIDNPELADAILAKITDFWIDFARSVLEAGRGQIDCLVNCNDFGTQRGLLMNPEQWRLLIKPHLKRFYDVIHSYGAAVLQHSCGAISDIIPDLIEIDADILDPIQVTADGMAPEMIANKFAGQIVLHGGIDTQNILPYGSEADVRKEVRRIIPILNARGKYILSGSQAYMQDIPLNNILAVYDEAAQIR